MFVPEDRVTHPDREGVLLVMSYQTRTKVEIETPEGRVVVPEHTLDRYTPPIEPYKSTRTESNEELLRIWDRVDALQEAVIKMDLDWRGHYKRGSDWVGSGWYTDEATRRQELFENAGLRYSRRDSFVLSLEDLERVLEAHEKGEALPDWVKIARGDTHRYGCFDCEGNHLFESNGLVIRPTEECPNPDGLVSEATLNIPSGKIIADDHLMPFNPLPMSFDINRVWGQHLRFLAHARHGEILGQVGNTCPTILKLSDGHFQIGSFRRPVWCVEDENGKETWVDECPEDRTDKYDNYGDDTEEALPDGAEEVGSICTDVWAYGIMDYDEAKRRAEHFGIDFEEVCAQWTFNVIDVKPGTYRFRHYNRVGRDAHTVVMGEFEWVGEATEPVDWINMWKNFQVTAGQAVQIISRKWPTLYSDPDEDWTHACAGVMGSSLRGCVPSRDWNRNGFRNDFLPEDVEGVEDRELPRFRFQRSWDIGRSMIDTAVSRNDELFGGDAPLNPSHAKAALRILESAISFGLPTRLDYKEGTYNVKATRGEMRKAVKLFHGLLERYPDAGEGMEDFVAWMRNKAAVNRWVKNFDLGPERAPTPDAD